MIKGQLSNIQQALSVHGQTIAIGAFMPVVSASISRLDATKLTRSHRAFPVGIDTGYSGTLYIAESHIPLMHHAGKDLSDLPYAGTRRLTDASGMTRMVPMHSAAVWLHGDVGGPVRIPVSPGIVYNPSGSIAIAAPPIPLIGGEFLRLKNIKLAVDYGALEFTLTW